MVIKMNSYDLNSITSAQIRAARALLGISAAELADKTRLGVATIRRAELQNGWVKLTTSNAQRIVQTLRDEGVSLIPENGGGVGVRFTEPCGAN